MPYDFNLVNTRQFYSSSKPFPERRALHRTPTRTKTFNYNWLYCAHMKKPFVPLLRSMLSKRQMVIFTARVKKQLVSLATFMLSYCFPVAFSAHSLDAVVLKTRSTEYFFQLVSFPKH